MDHRSTAFPCPFLFNTSGATYPKLPASDMSCSSEECRCFALWTKSKPFSKGDHEDRRDSHPEVGDNDVGVFVAGAVKDVLGSVGYDGAR